MWVIPHRAETIAVPAESEPANAAGRTRRAGKGGMLALCTAARHATTAVAMSAVTGWFSEVVRLAHEGLPG